MNDHKPADMELARFYVEREPAEDMSTRAAESDTTLHRLEGGRKPELSAGLKCLSAKGRWGIRMGMCWRMRCAMRCWGRRGWGISGRIFPDTDPKWKGANSMVFLEHAKKLLD